MIKLKLGSKAAAFPNGESSPRNATAASPPPSATPTSASGPAPVKLKLNVSQPPTPIEPHPQASFPLSAPAGIAEKKKRPYQRKQDGTAKGKKRPANDDISPAPKRAASGPGLTRKFSIKIGGSQPTSAAEDGTKLPKLTLGKRKQSIPKFVELRARGKAPPRPKGVGYDSEDSDVETDPAIQQALVLRMEEGEDAKYLRAAIAEGKIGPQTSQGDAEVSLKFVEKNYRRALIKVRGNMYAAILVDLPCIVESMKSFDRKAWYKVADIAQMLLVLGRCNSEDEAKTYPLPREVNKDNYQYAHGLTPPMHMVRKRRFRKRMSYADVINVDEEVERLLKADAEWEDGGGKVVNDLQQRAELEQSMEPQDYDMDEDAEDEAIETVETDGQDYEGEEDYEDAEDEDDLANQMQAMFDADTDNVEGVSELISESPAAIPDQAASIAAAEAMVDDAEATPAATPREGAGMSTQDEQSSDEDESDEDDDADSPDAFDEDAAAKAALQAQQLEEVQDLEREVERARLKVQSMGNQLLRQREMQKLAALEEDLRVKKGVFGLETED